MTIRIPAKEITGPYGALVKVFSRRVFGRVPESLGVMWHNVPVAGLNDQLGPAAVVELTSVIGFANLTTRGNVALGIESEGFAAACDLRPMAVRPGVASAS